MVGLTETPQWVDEVYQIETTDPVVGGPPDLALAQGFSNIPHSDLANRTAWLKEQVETLKDALDNLDLSEDVSNAVNAAINALLDGAPGALDTLNELAAALGDDPNFAATITAALAETVQKTRTIATGVGLKGGGNLSSDRTLAADIATQAQAEAGVSETHLMTPAGVAHAIAKQASGAVSGIPSGAIMAFAMNTAPIGWLKADGSEVSRTTYADLFAEIGTQYGAGDGTTTFALPDLRGEFVRGWDDGRGIDPSRVLGSAQNDQNKSHSHAFGGSTSTTGNHSHGGVAQFTTGVQLGAGGQTGFRNASGTTAAAGNHSHSFSGTTSTSGGDEARPRNLADIGTKRYAQGSRSIKIRKYTRERY